MDGNLRHCVTICGDKVLGRSNLWKEGFILVSNSRASGWGKDVMAGNRELSMVREQEGRAVKLQGPPP